MFAYRTVAGIRATSIFRLASRYSQSAINCAIVILIRKNEIQDQGLRTRSDEVESIECWLGFVEYLGY